MFVQVIRFDNVWENWKKERASESKWIVNTAQWPPRKSFQRMKSSDKAFVRHFIYILVCTNVY